MLTPMLRKPFALVAIAVATTGAFAAIGYVSVDRISAEPSVQSAPPSDVQSLQASVDKSSPQAAALADGIVTYSEHEQAISAWIACVAAAGGTARTWPGEGLRPTMVAFQFLDADGQPDADSARHNQETVAACQQENLDAVDSAWAGQMAQPQGAALEALYERLEACVADGGVPGQDVSTPMNFAPYPLAPGDRAITLQPEQQQSYIECALAEQATTGFRAPVPLVAGVPAPAGLAAQHS